MAAKPSGGPLEGGLFALGGGGLGLEEGRAPEDAVVALGLAEAFGEPEVGAALASGGGELGDDGPAPGLEDAVVGEVEFAEDVVVLEGGAEDLEGDGDELASFADDPGRGDAAELVALEVEALEGVVDAACADAMASIQQNRDQDGEGGVGGGDTTKERVQSRLVSAISLLLLE